MPDIIVVGGGFGGVEVARRLGRKAAVTLVTDDNYLLFTPMLAEVAAGDIEPRHVAAPIRQLAPYARIVPGHVVGIRTEGPEVTVRSLLSARQETIAGDAVVVASGARPATFGVAGTADHALGFKTIADALAIRRRSLAFLEEAAATGDGTLTATTIIGGGYSGVELAAAMADFWKRAHPRFYPTAPHPRITLVDAASRVVPTLPDRLGRAATRALLDRNVELVLGTPVTALERGQAVLGDGRTINSGTIVWAAGVRPAPPPGLPTDERGRVAVDGRFRAASRVFALGDVAAVPDGHGGTCPPTAQHALRQGAWLGKNLPELLDGAEPPRFRYRNRGELVSLGHRNAVGRVFGVGISGIIAWWLWRSYYWARLPTMGRKARVSFDWTLDLIFPPDIAAIESGDLGPLPDLPT